MRRIWFFDDEQLPARYNVERRVHRPRKHPANPLMAPLKPWEGKGVCLEWPSVLYDEEERLFKAWYEAHRDGKSFGCYATSEDGIHWKRPDLGLIPFRGSRKNNICYRGVFRTYTAKCVNVMKRGPGDYHMYYWDALRPGGPAGVIHLVSKDGVRWKYGRVNPVVQTPLDRTRSYGADDVLRVSYDAKGRRFLLSIRTIPFENLEKPFLQKKVPSRDGLWQRRISIATSGDGEHFDALRTVMVPPLNDPFNVQFYGLSPFRFEDFYLGHLMTFRTGTSYIDVELAHSRNGEDWARVLPNFRYIPNGKPPAFDCGLIHTSPYPIRVGEKLYIYYWGTTSNHSGGTIADAPRLNALALAVADPRRMVSILAPIRPGSVLVGPFKAGRRLMFDADAGKGEMKVALRDPETYEEIRGFDLNRSDVIKSNSHEHLCTWRGKSDTSKLAGRKVLAHVHLTKAEIFSLATA